MIDGKSTVHAKTPTYCIRHFDSAPKRLSLSPSPQASWMTGRKALCLAWLVAKGQRTCRPFIPRHKIINFVRDGAYAVVQTLRATDGTYHMARIMAVACDPSVSICPP